MSFARFLKSAGEWHVVGAVGEPAFENSFNTYDAVNGGTTFGPVQFRKDSDGFVHLKGLLDGTTTAGTKVMFTLSVGYRPAYDELFLQHTQSGSGYKVIAVRATGAVEVVSHAANDYVSISGITFYAEA